MKTMEFIFSQVFGLFALIFVSLSYFLKDRSKFLIVQMCVNLSYSAAFFIVGTNVGGIIMLISSLRCLYLYIAEKKEFKYIYQLLMVFILLYIIFAIIFWKDWFDLISLIAGVLFTIGFAFKKIEIGRSFFIVATLLYMTSNIIATTYISAVANFVEVIVIFCSIVKFHSNIINQKSE